MLLRARFSAHKMIRGSIARLGREIISSRRASSRLANSMVPHAPARYSRRSFAPALRNLKYDQSVTWHGMATRCTSRSKHRMFTTALRGSLPGEAVEIPKTRVRTLPESYEETLLGTPPSVAVSAGRRQYRGPYGRHVYETDRSWVVHRDAADPRRDPIGHLVTDAPEWGAALLAGSVVGYAAGVSRYERALREGADEKAARWAGLVDGLIAGGLAGLGAFAAVAVMRSVLNGE